MTPTHPLRPPPSVQGHGVGGGGLTSALLRACPPGRQWRPSGHAEKQHLVADWGHELGVRLRQGEQARRVRERDDVYRLDLPTNEGDFPVPLAQSSDTCHSPGVYELWSRCWELRAAQMALHPRSPRPSPCPPVTAGGLTCTLPSGRGCSSWLTAQG